MDKVGETTLFLDLAALEHNYNYLRSRIAPETKFMAVVKAFAYGSDMVAVAKKMEKLGIVILYPLIKNSLQRAKNDRVL